MENCTAFNPARCASMEEADAMYEACERYGVKFNMGTQRRFTPGYIKMREIVERGGNKK
jgi:predicted dehydrogenase